LERFSICSQKNWPFYTKDSLALNALLNCVITVYCGCFSFG
jgi:hypothetical protein